MGSTVAPEGARIEAALAERWRTWAREVALPFWREQRRSSGLFLERLHLDGSADETAPLRLRTHARQVYVFAHAYLMGLDEAGGEVARDGFEVMVASGYRPDGSAGWIHALTPAGDVLDGRRDLYDHAFVLLALAYLLRLQPPPADARRLLDATTALFDTVFAASHGGFAETAEGGLPRRQNPHMHLLEASLALFETTGDAAHLARARALVDLFRERFFDRRRGVVREYFTGDWSLLPGDGSDRVEPGHLAEWVWLLDRVERLMGEPTAAERQILFANALRLGITPGSDGFLVDETDPHGTPLGDSRRLWPQTELLKALVVQARSTGDPKLWQQADAVTERLFQTYLAEVPAGTWRDRFTVAGVPAVDHIPASTLYHLLGVVATIAPA